MRRQRLMLPVATVVAGLVVLAGCGTPYNGPRPDSRPSNSPVGTTSQAPAPAPEPTPVTLTSNVGADATDVTVDTVVELEAGDGTLAKVTLSYVGKDKAGKSQTVTVPGSISKDGTTWKAADRLDPGAAYSLVAETTSVDGSTATQTRTFTTQALSLDQQIFPSIYPLADTTVGVGMPAVVTFDWPVTDRETVQKHLKITTAPKQEGSWYWLNDKEVHFRPKTYWQAGTKISVEADLNGIPTGKNEAGTMMYGQVSRGWSFTVGRKVVAKVDLRKQRMNVFVDDKQMRSIAVSTGKEDFITRNGTKVIAEKLRSTPMRSETESISDPEYYNLPAVNYALRLTNSGEFFHAAPWNAPYFGKVGVSHGCTGMSDADAAWLFATMNVGDVAEFTGGNRPMEAGNGWADWNLTWAQIREKSAD